jgi:hypothetical protein
MARSSPVLPRWPGCPCSASLVALFLCFFFFARCAAESPRHLGMAMGVRTADAESRSTRKQVSAHTKNRRGGRKEGEAVASALTAALCVVRDV